jgi:putative transposase
VSETGLRKSYTYKLKPTTDQERVLNAPVWLCRQLYNAGLEQRICAYRKCDVSVMRYQQDAELKDLRASMPDYAAIHSHVLQDMLARLDRTYQAFFKRVNAGQTPGIPPYQGRNRYHAFTYKEFGDRAQLDTGFLVLSKIGRVAVRWSRRIEGKPKTVTISQEADGWYAIFSCVEAPEQPMPLTGKETDIDVGLKVFLVTADGLEVDNPGHHRHAEKHLAKAQRRCAKRQKGCHRRKKAAQCCAKRQQKVKRQRADVQQKTARMLVQQYDTIYLEEVPLSTVVRNHSLAKSIQDAGWAQFRAILVVKAACAGKQVVAAPPQYTSQGCSGCGERVPKSLSVRTQVCQACGLVMDSDETRPGRSHGPGRPFGESWRRLRR